MAEADITVAAGTTVEQGTAAGMAIAVVSAMPGLGLVIITGLLTAVQDTPSRADHLLVSTAAALTAAADSTAVA
jgi:hypothetical protein